MLVDLRPFDAELTGKEAQNVLDQAGHHAQQEHDPRRAPLAVRHQRRAHRHAGGHHPGHDRGRDGRRSASSSAGRCAAATDAAELAAVRDDVANLCSKFTPVPLSASRAAHRAAAAPTGRRSGVAVRIAE